MTFLPLHSPHYPNIKIIIIGFILSALRLTASPPTVGQVIAPDDTPIPYVTVYNKSSDAWLISDEYGKIFFTNQHAAGDTLEFRRIGFQNTKLTMPDSVGIFQINLSYAPVAIGAVEIAGRIQSQNPGGSFTRITVPGELGIIESGQILSSIPGTYIRSYGGPAGITTLSLDGAPSSHTNIFFSGFDLTSAQNGQVDISQLPSSLIGAVEYSPNLTESSPEIGNAEGSIRIQPPESETGFSISIGSFGHRSLTGRIARQTKRSRFYFSLGKRHDDADYRVINPISGTSLTRDNNTFEQKYLTTTLTTVISTNLFWKTMLMSSHQERGVAGLIWSPTPNATRSDKISMIGSKLGWVNRFGHGYFQLLMKQSTEHYLNPQNNINADHALSTYHLLIKQTGTMRQLIRWYLYSDIRYDYLRSTNTDTHDRFSNKTMAAVTCLPFAKISFSPTIVHNYSPNLFSTFDYDLQIRWHFADNKGLLYTNAGKFYRYPTFNDLYWEPGGNPDLRPEHTAKIAGGFELNEFASFSLKTNIYYKESKNLILWTPIQSYWQPKNIEKAVRKGYKIGLQWQRRGIPVSINALYNHAVSRNLTPGDYYQKPLRYAPRETSSLTFDWRPDKFYIALQMQHVSRRIAMFSWPEDQTLQPYTVYSLNLSYSLENRLGTFIIVGAINNLGDSAYETLLGYPEPPRSFRLTLNYKTN